MTYCLLLALINLMDFFLTWDETYANTALVPKWSHM